MLESLFNKVAGLRPPVKFTKFLRTTDLKIRFARLLLSEGATRAEACNFIKKETLGQVFSREFCEIPKNTFFTEHLWTTASTLCK